MPNMNRIWGSTGAVNEPDPTKVEEGWNTTEFPRHDWQNWFMNLVSTVMQSIERNGVMAWDTAVPYKAGVVVIYAGGLYFSVADTTGQQPDITPSVWTPLTVGTRLPIAGVDGLAAALGEKADADALGTAAGRDVGTGSSANIPDRGQADSRYVRSGVGQDVSFDEVTARIFWATN